MFKCKTCFCNFFNTYTEFNEDESRYMVMVCGDCGIITKEEDSDTINYNKYAYLPFGWVVNHYPESAGIIKHLHKEFIILILIGPMLTDKMKAVTYFYGTEMKNDGYVNGYPDLPKIASLDELGSVEGNIIFGEYEKANII